VTTLLDANVLIALIGADHVHHAAAEDWITEIADRFATCPTTPGRTRPQGQKAATALAVVATLADDPRYEFWPNGLPYHTVPMQGVIGHRQVTDAYLARAHQRQLATLDQGLAKLHGDDVDLVPTA